MKNLAFSGVIFQPLIKNYGTQMRFTKEKLLKLKHYQMRVLNNFVKQNQKIKNL